MTEPVIETRDLTVAYRAHPVLWDVDISIRPGTMTAIVGPNGAGKSTLLKTILGMVSPASGWVKVLGGSFSQHRGNVAYVPQRGAVDWDFPTNALDVVMMGQYGKLGWVRRPGQKERQIAIESLRRVKMEAFADRQISQLSGGQQQRVFLARALAQDAQLYILDEPLAGVDAVTERVIIQIFRELRDSGKSVVVVHHDLQTVPSYFDDVILLNVRLVASGTVADAFTPENLQAAYGGRVAFLDTNQTGESAPPPTMAVLN